MGALPGVVVSILLLVYPFVSRPIVQAITLNTTNISEDCRNLGIALLMRIKNATDLLDANIYAIRDEILVNHLSPLTRDDALAHLRKSQNANFSNMDAYGFCWMDLNQFIRTPIIRPLLWCDFEADFNRNTYSIVGFRFNCRFREGEALRVRFVTLRDNSRADGDAITLDFGLDCSFGRLEGKRTLEWDGRVKKGSFSLFLWVAVGVVSLLATLGVGYGLLLLYQKFCSQD